MYPTQPMVGAEIRNQKIFLSFPPQHQNHMPGLEEEMQPRPISENPACKGSGKLLNQVALISGGDSGIGRAVAYAFAKEGADVAIAFYKEIKDALETKKRVEEIGRQCLVIQGDLRQEKECQDVVALTIKHLGRLDILVNNCAVQYVRQSIVDITEEQLVQTFRSNFFSYFFLTKAALPHLKRGNSIINTSSVTAYAGSPHLIDYSATKGAIVAFTRSLALSLADSGIRVNGVAPGPIWTPLIPASFSPHEVATFGTGTSSVPLQRPGQPFEVAGCYVFLASDDSSYMSGQILHPNGGQIING